MRRSSRLRRTVLWLFVVVFVPVAAGIVGTVIPRPLFTDVSAEPDTAMRRVLLLYNPIHTDIAFPAHPDVLDRLAFLADDGLPLDHPNLRWIVLGWGGRSFYLETPTWADLKPLPVLRALTVDRSVMHVALAGDIDSGSANVDELRLSQARFEALLDQAMLGFRRDGNDKPRIIAGQSYGDSDRFYEANGLFNAVVGCNTWAARVLRAGGARTGLWNPLPVSLRWSLALFGACPLGGGQCRI